ncbi:MAG: MalY/PatB family protein [Anaerolineae bacterium]
MNERHTSEAHTPTSYLTSPDLPYDFDKIIDRRQTDSIKWQNYDEGVLPMWVADMDFRSPPAVVRALRKRAEHGIFGYEKSPSDLSELIAERIGRLYDWEVAPEAIVFLPGIVAGFNVASRAFVTGNEALMVQTPVYMHILDAAEDAGVQGQAMALTQGADGRYGVDLDLFEATITAQTRLFLLCNPHNPVGRVFTREELTAMADICLRHDLIVCSDEIHCDLIYSGHRHIPIAALDEEIASRTVTLMAPSKTFNIAGLHCGFAVIPNADLRRQYNHGRGGLVSSPNLMGYTAARAAYAEGEPWLQALLQYLEGNRDCLVKYLAQEMPQLKMAPPEGTYLAWIDCREAGLPTSPQRFFLEHGRVAFNDGAAFGPGGEGFIRLNFGCPRQLLLEGLDRMRRALTAL